MFEEDPVALVQPRPAFRVRDDVVRIEDRLAKSPDAALIDRLAARAASVESVAIDLRPVALHFEQAAAVAGVADLRDVVRLVTGDADQAFAHCPSPGLRPPSPRSRGARGNTRSSPSPCWRGASGNTRSSSSP